MPLPCPNFCSYSRPVLALARSPSRFSKMACPAPFIGRAVSFGLVRAEAMRFLHLPLRRVLRDAFWCRDLKNTGTKEWGEKVTLGSRLLWDCVSSFVSFSTIRNDAPGSWGMGPPALRSGSALRTPQPLSAEHRHERKLQAGTRLLWFRACAVLLAWKHRGFNQRIMHVYSSSALQAINIPPIQGLRTRTFEPP